MFLVKIMAVNLENYRNLFIFALRIAKVKNLNIINCALAL